VISRRLPDVWLTRAAPSTAFSVNHHADYGEAMSCIRLPRGARWAIESIAVAIPPSKATIWGAVQCSAVQCSAVRCGAVRRGARFFGQGWFGQLVGQWSS